MDERFLLKLALLTSIASLAILLIIVKDIKLEESSIADAKQSDDGEKLSVSGIVESVSTTKSATFIKIKKEETLTVVVFQNISIKKGDWVLLEGKVSDYNGEKEIVAEKIVKE